MLKKGNRLEYLVFGGFIIGGLLFLTLGIYAVFSRYISKDNRVYTTAIIEKITTYRDNDGDIHHNVFILYEVNGFAYEAKIGYLATYREGQEVEVYYDKNNPKKVQTESDNIGWLIFLILPLIVIVIGASGIAKIIKRKKKLKQLKTTGKTIYATYIATELNTSYSVNGKNPYTIICEWNDSTTNKKYIFESENLWFNPEEYIQRNNITTFPVIINPDNIEEYVIDVSVIKNNIVDLTH